MEWRLNSVYMGSLTGNSIIVTGASHGLGRSMALRFSKEGAAVTLVSRSRDALEAVAEEAEGSTLVVPADVRKDEDVSRVVKRTHAEFERIDTLVNNAGVGLLSLTNERKPVIDITADEWDTVMETNLKGVFLFCRHTVPKMIAQGRGNVINISSGYGRRAVPNMAPYITSKWGIEGFTRALSMEVEDDGVLVNGLDPGERVDTRFWDHVNDKSDIATPNVMNDAAVLLAAQGAGGVTGESMNAKDWEKRLTG